MDLQDLLKRTGLTQKALAEKLGIRQPSVARWKLRGIPVARVADVERVTGISRSQLRPDIFGSRQ